MKCSTGTWCICFGHEKIAQKGVLNVDRLSSVFNIEVFSTCQMPKKDMYIYMHLWHFTKMCFVKFLQATMKASPKTACHKIQCLQFANKNITGLQSWHSNRHFQISITPAISTLQLRLEKHNYICEHGFEHWNACAHFKLEHWLSSQYWYLGCVLEHTQVTHVQVVSLLMNNVSAYNLSEVEFEQVIINNGLIIVTLIS